jgi:death-on-curing protein
MDAPIWISKDLAIAIHKRQLAEHGGAEGIRDEGLLDSALSRARNRVACEDPAPSVAMLAASYAFGIARNHAFIDGTKRTAYVVCRTFLIVNGVDLTADRAERYQTFLALAEGSLSEADLTTWLTGHTKPVE